MDVTVREAGEAGAGASEHSFAWTNAFNKKPRHYHDLNRRSVEMWHRFVGELGVPEVFTCNGNLVIENTEERAEVLRAQVRELQELALRPTPAGAGKHHVHPGEYAKSQLKGDEASPLQA